MLWQIMEATNLDSALVSTSEIIPSDDCSSICCTKRAIKDFSSDVSRQNSAVRLQLHSCVIIKGDVLSTVKIFHSGYHACDRIQELIMYICFL